MKIEHYKIDTLTKGQRQGNQKLLSPKQRLEEDYKRAKADLKELKQKGKHEEVANHSIYCRNLEKKLYGKAITKKYKMPYKRRSCVRSARIPNCKKYVDRMDQLKEIYETGEDLLEDLDTDLSRATIYSLAHRQTIDPNLIVAMNKLLKKHGLEEIDITENPYHYEPEDWDEAQDRLINLFKSVSMYWMEIHLDWPSGSINRALIHETKKGRSRIINDLSDVSDQELIDEYKKTL